MPSIKQILVASAALVASSASVASANEEDKCGLYLAVSSTSTVEEPKWGVYTGKPYPKDANIGYGEVAIQLHNFLANTQSASTKSDEDAAHEQLMANAIDFFEQYIWVPASSGAQNELGPDGGRIVTAIPGAGVLGAYHPKLTNTDWNHTSAYHRPLLNEGDAGEPHPGRGAQSHFYDVNLRAVTNIPAGMEIFVNYGDNWSPDGEAKTDSTEDDITQDDHAKIDETITKMRKFFEKYQKDLNDQSKMDIYNFLTRDVMNAAAGSKKGQKIAALLPPSPDQLAQIERNGGITSVAEPTAIRSVEWLAQFGRCMDLIKAGPSTVPYAGRGAFATRAIAKDGLVSPIPLIQIATEHILNMHNLHKVTNDEAEDGDDPEFLAKASDEIIGNQMLLNYVYGHPSSTLMFFPAGASTAFINHSKEPNAKMVWSSHPNNHKHWFELTPEQLIEDGNKHIGLLMEIVALRDIEEGEEIFIDYGSEWQQAWEEHVAKWQRLVGDGTLPKVWPIRALDINGANQISPKQFLTVEEQKTFPYPSNLQMKCFLVLDMPSEGPATSPSGSLIRDWSEPKEANAKPAIDTENLFDCNIVAREEDMTGDALWHYTIESEGNGLDEPTTIVRKVPHKAIVFIDAPQTSDHFLADGFRHYIGIPNDVFPQGPWRNAE